MFTTLPYHLSSVNFFRKQTSTWEYFSQKSQKDENLKEFKVDLLKSTYRFDETSESSLYTLVNVAKEKLNLLTPVMLYQSEHANETNASIVYLDNEAHIIFSGKIIQCLSNEELLAIIGHELTHIHLYNQLNGDIEITDRIITSIANRPEATPSQYETARLFKLYSEIFCDRGAAIVSGSFAPIISALVKISTGLPNVNVDSYVKQAESIFQLEDGAKTSGVSHPENFIRARALQLWYTRTDKHEALIEQMIEGSASLDELDLFKQQKLSDITYQILQVLLYPNWMQTTRVIALAKQYFGLIEWKESPDTQKLAFSIQGLHKSQKEYLSYVLYDIADTDKEMEDIPLGFCFSLAEQLQLDTSFSAVVKKERKLTDKKTKILKQKAIGEYQKQNLQTV